MQLTRGRFRQWRDTSRTRLVSQAGNDFVLAIAEQTVSGTVVRDGEQFHVFSQGAHTVLAL